MDSFISSLWTFNIFIKAILNALSCNTAILHCSEHTVIGPLTSGGDILYWLFFEIVFCDTAILHCSKPTVGYNTAKIYWRHIFPFFIVFLLWLLGSWFVVNVILVAEFWSFFLFGGYSIC